MSGINVVQDTPTPNIQELIVANSVYLDFGDFVTINSDGFLKRTAATEKIAGCFSQLGGVTYAADNQTVGLLKGKYQPVTDDQVFELTADQACTQTDLGQYADIKLSTNAFQCDLNSGATGQLHVIDFDPERNGSTTIVRCKVAEPQDSGFAQT